MRQCLFTILVTTSEEAILKSLKSHLLVTIQRYFGGAMLHSVYPNATVYTMQLKANVFLYSTIN